MMNGQKFCKVTGWGQKLAGLLTLLAVLVLPAFSAKAAEGKVLTDIAYKTGKGLSDYEKERCKLELYLPEQKSGFATLVWFHGGGLKTGLNDLVWTRDIAKSFVEGGVAVVIVKYRFSPQVTYPAYVEDAAAAFAWTYNNIAKYGGDPRKVFISGHSAGGYLAAITGLNPRFLAANKLTLDAVAGILPVSGQMMTHFTVREERGLPKYSIIADEAAPIHFCGKVSPPMLVLYADHDMATRMEEDIYFVSTMKAAGNKVVRGLLIKDRNHGTIAKNLAHLDDPARKGMLDFMNEISREREQAKAAK